MARCNIDEVPVERASEWERYIWFLQSGEPCKKSDTIEERMYGRVRVQVREVGGLEKSVRCTKSEQAKQ